VPARVVILGAGFGGLELSRLLSDELGDDVQIILLDQNDSFMVGFSKFDILFGRAPAPELRMYYRDLGIDRVRFLQERVTAVDPSGRTATTDEGTYEGDFLVVAMGAQYAPEATPGFVEGGHEFYSVAGAERMAGAIDSFSSGSLVFGVLGVPYKCPPAPYEFMFLLHDRLAERGVRDEVEISFFNPMPSPLPPSPEISEAMMSGMTERGIAYEFGHRVKSIDPSSLVAELGDGREVGYDLFVGVPVHRVPDVVEASGLTEGGTDGWIKVDPRSLETPFEGVYAVGDCADPPVPRAGTFAESGAATVAAHIVSKVRGEEFRAPFSGRGTCYVELGGGQVAKVEADFLSGPKPILDFVTGSNELGAEKARFLTDRRSRWFGSR
jgi:sulfide:quinone oxidoreductase